MTVVAQITVPAEAFALGDAMAAAPEMRVEADRIAAHSPDATMPCLWASEGDDEAFEAALRNDASVAEVREVERFDDERLYHVTWADPVREIVANVVDHEGSVVEASGRDGRWRFRIRFMTRDQFEEFRSFATDAGIPFALERLFDADRPRRQYGTVTPDQYEALVAAAEAGYFRVPRESSTEELAAALGISSQSVSERLRRGTENLVRSSLTAELDSP